MPNALRTEHLVQAGRAPGVQAQNALRVRGMAQGNVMREFAIREAELLEDERPFRKETAAFEWMSKVIPLITLENYDDFWERSIQRGWNPKLLAKKDQIYAWAQAEGIPPEEALENFKLWSTEQLDIFKAETGRIAAEKVGTSRLPKEGATRDKPLKGNMMQRQEYKNGEWVNLGDPVTKFAPKAGVKTEKEKRYKNAVELVKTSMKTIKDPSVIMLFAKRLEGIELTDEEDTHIKDALKRLKPAVREAMKTIDEYWGVKGQAFVFKEGRIQEQ